MTEATTQSPADAEAFLFLGLSHDKMKRPIEAKVALNKTVGLAPGTPIATQAQQALQQIK